MVINKNSWHYKLVEFGANSRFDISDNLCTYFWQLVRGFLLSIVALAFVCLLICAICFMLAAPFISLIMFEAVFVSIGWIISGYIIKFAFHDTISENHYLMIDVFAKLKPKERKPSIITEYLKAKKQKICPTITFE